MQQRVAVVGIDQVEDVVAHRFESLAQLWVARCVVGAKPSWDAL